MVYNVNGKPNDTMFTASSKIEKLALSSESSRVAAALSDGTVCLWDSGNAGLVDSFDGFDNHSQSRLKFSSTGTRLAYSSVNNIVKLRDGISGRFIADLRCGSYQKFQFSGDGSRFASLSSFGSLILWNSESGEHIADAVVMCVWDCAISANGSLLATSHPVNVTLWSENRNHLAQIKVLKVDGQTSIAFSLDNIVLAITTCYSDIKLYNVKTHSFIRTLPARGGLSTTFSPDCTRLAVKNINYIVKLWDIQGIDVSGPPSEGNPTAVTALALSRDCSRLACGFENGTVELWGTNPTMRRLGPVAFHSKIEKFFTRIFHQPRHTKSVSSLGFDPDGRLFASGSFGGIKLWNGGDGVLRGTLKASGVVCTVALSNSVVVAGEPGGVTLWRLDTLSPIHTFKIYNPSPKVSIAENSALIAVCFDRSQVPLFDVVNLTTVCTFDGPSNIHTMTFLLDNSQLVIQSRVGVFQSFDLINNQTTEGPMLEHLLQLPNIPLWHGVPVWHCIDEAEQHYFSALYSQHKNPIPVLWIPKQIASNAWKSPWAQGSSMIALGCTDGRVILLRLPTSHVS